MSGSVERLAVKQPIRRFEIQINNFNVAIPHHVNVLKRHRNNIKKYQNQHSWELVRKEHVNVSRIIVQLKELLYQMDTLRAQVLDANIDQFDKLTRKARESIMCTLEEYLEMQLNLPTSPSAASSAIKHEDTEGTHPPDDSYVQTQVEDLQEDLQRQQECLHVWNTLQGDMQQLHELYTEFNRVVHDQKETVDNMVTNVEEAQVNVQEGTRFLQQASRYKAVAYPVAGAVIGTCLGGPIGLLAGMKIGSLAALSCGILGFTGGSLLKRKQITSHRADASNGSKIDLQCVKKSVSCPDNLEVDKKEL